MHFAGDLADIVVIGTGNPMYSHQHGAPHRRRYSRSSVATGAVACTSYFSVVVYSEAQGCVEILFV